MHEKKRKNQIELDIEKRIQGNKNYDFLEDYKSGVKYIKNKEVKINNAIKEIYGTAKNDAYMIELSKYLINSDSTDIMELIEEIEQLKEYDKGEMADIYYGIAEMFRYREEYMPWHSKTNQTPLKVGFFMYLEKAVTYYELAKNNSQLRIVYKKIGEAKVGFPGQIKRAEECYKVVLGFIDSELQSYIRLDQIEFAIIKRIMVEIQQIAEGAYKNGLYSIIKESVSIMRRILNVNMHRYGAYGIGWEEEMREMAQLRLCDEYESITCIPQEWGEREENEEYNQSYYNDRDSLRASAREMTARMQKRLREQLNEITAAMNIEDKKNMYKQGIYKEVEEDNVLSVMKEVYREAEYYKHLAWILNTMNIEDKKEVLKTIIQPMNDNSIEPQDEFDDWLYGEYNKVAQEQRELPNIKKIKKKNRHQKIMAYEGFFSLLLEEMNNAMIEREDLTIYIVDMVECSKEENFNYYIAQGYKYMMYNKINIAVQESLECYYYYKEIIKMTGNRIEAMVEGIRYAEHLKKKGQIKEVNKIKSQLQVEYEVNKMTNQYKTDVGVERRRHQIKKLKQI